MVYYVRMESLGSEHTFGPYKSARKANEVFNLVSDIAPVGAEICIVLKER